MNGFFILKTSERNEKELKRAQEITQIGSWNINLESNEVTWSEELYKLYGFDTSLPPPILTESMKLFIPESWELLSSSIAKVTETGIPYEIELGLVKKDGNIRWMWARGEAIKDEKGKIIGLWGATQDITERKKVELKLKKYQEHLEELVKERTLELEIKNEELSNMNKVFVGRELRMAELKQIIKEIEERLTNK